MSEQERMLDRLAEMLSQVARPHALDDDEVSLEVRSRLCQLGFPCSELTTREELISRLWARKRMLMAAMQPQWGGGPGITPPSAA
jgi:hypothetical protein